MKRQDSTFRLKRQALALLLLACLMSSVSLIFAQESHSAFERTESVGGEGSPEIDVLHSAWQLAVRYRYEEVPDNYDISQDPKMEEIWSLRGVELRYFLDSIEAINRVQTEMFPPSLLVSENTQYLTLMEERQLIELVTARVFSETLDSQRVLELEKREREYVTQLEIVLNAMIDGNGDRFFTPEYLQYRTGILTFIEDTGMELFSPSHEAIDSYLEYFAMDKKQAAELNPDPTPQEACDIVYTIDNWPSKSTVFSGNTGSSWREAKAHDQNDCDIFVGYAMGTTTPQYGRISANTSSAQCVLDKTTQLRGSWVGNFNNVQYGKITVTWIWPFGCHTTGSDLRQATKWRP